MWTSHRHVPLFLLILCLGVLGCIPHPEQALPDGIRQVPLDPGSVLGQTFVARANGLNGYSVHLELDGQAAGTLRFSLRESPGSSENLHQTEIDLKAVQNPGPIEFLFPAIPNSNNNSYYAAIELTGTGSMAIRTVPGASYLDGALYIDRAPQNAQMAFGLRYASGYALLGLLGESITWIGFTAVGLFLFIWPGWVLISEVNNPNNLPKMAQFGLAAGFGLALYPVIFLWADVIGFRLGRLTAGAPALVATGWVIWKLLRGEVAKLGLKVRRWNWRSVSIIDLILWVAILLIFWTRFYAVRGVEAPLWGDSVQHAVITQLITENGGLFESWLPYAPFKSLTVHYGFSVGAAVLAWFTGLESPQATLIFGQLLNVLAVVAIYPLAVKVSKGSKIAGLGAVAAAGLLSPMPAFFVNWGRYAQLYGQAILPVAIWFIWELAEAKKMRWGSLVFVVVTLAGMMLSYYRVPYYLLTFLLAWALFWGRVQWKFELKTWVVRVLRIGAGGLFALLVFLPWGLRISQGQLADALVGGVVAGSPVDRVIQEYRLWRELLTYVPLPLLLISTASLIWSLVKRQAAVLAVGFWVLLLASLVGMSLLRVPGTNLMQTFAIQIALYIPVGILVAWLLAQVQAWLQAQNSRSGLAVLYGLLLLGMLFGAADQQAILDTDTFALVTRPDLDAFQWIENNTGEDAVFLVEGFRIYEGFSAVGADAGWWIPLYTGRQNVIPPQYALLNEEPIDPGYLQNILDLLASFEGDAQGHVLNVENFCTLDITHVYIGQRQGEVGFIAEQLYSPEAFLSDPNFDLVYHKDRVHIFEGSPALCQESPQS